jgi:hypothetical protein
LLQIVDETERREMVDGCDFELLAGLLLWVVMEGHGFGAEMKERWREGCCGFLGGDWLFLVRTRHGGNVGLGDDEGRP